MASIKTRITSLLGIKHPIILPGMSWISKPELVAAVSNAGGLGILATGPLTGMPCLMRMNMVPAKLLVGAGCG